MWNSVRVTHATYPRAGNIRRLFNFATPTLGLRTTAKKLEVMARSKNGKLEVDVKRDGLYVDGNRLPWSGLVGLRLYGQIDKMSIELKGQATTRRRLVRETMNAIILSKLKDYSESLFGDSGIPHDKSDDSRNKRIILAGDSFFFGTAPFILLSAWAGVLSGVVEEPLFLGLTTGIPFGIRLYQKLLTYTYGAIEDRTNEKIMSFIADFSFKDICSDFKGWIKRRKLK